MSDYLSGMRPGDFTFSINFDPAPPPPPRYATVTIGGRVLGVDLYADRFEGEIADFVPSSRPDELLTATGTLRNVKRMPVELWRRVAYHVVGRPVFAVSRWWNGVR